MRCALAVLLACLLSVSLSAQAQLSDGYMGQGQEETLPMPLSPGSELSDISNGLRTTADELDSLFLKLNGLLMEAGLSQTDLDFTLTASMQSAENGIDSIKDSLKQYRAQRLEIWIWRGTTALGVIGIAVALTWGLTK